MISVPDVQVIVLYLVLLCAIGWGFRRFTKNFEEYFAGGRRMVWWLLGADSFQSNFSCWIFTGAAGVAYAQGGLIFGFFLVDVLGFALAYAGFSARFRRLNVLTALDAVRHRFSARDETFFAVLSIITSVAFASMRVLGLGVIFSHAFALPSSAVIGLTMAVVIFVALLGGSWAVAAINVVQLVVVVSVTGAVAVLAISHVGGWGAFIAQVPSDHWQLFKPIGSTQYDWLFIVSGLLSAAYAKNNLLFVSKYAPARDAEDARRSSLIPLFGYLVMPIVWMIPVFAAFTVVPDLTAQEAAGHAGEWAYISVCTKILPPGLMGLVVVCMLAATVSSVGMALNSNAGILAHNLYGPWRKGRAQPPELLVAGKIATLMLGLVIGGGSLLLAASHVTLFDALLYIGGYVSVPVAIPLFLGLVMKGEPAWAPRATVLFGVLATVTIYHGLPAFLNVFQPSGAFTRFLSYFVENRFVATNLLIVPASALFFLLSVRLSRGPDAKTVIRQSAFFERSMQPIPAVELRDSAHARQSRMIGRLLAGSAIFIAALGLLPNLAAARVAILSCSVLPGLLATLLLCWARHLDGLMTQSIKSAASRGS